MAYVGFRAKALSRSGAVAAMLTGGTILGFGGLPWALLLVFFFASSSLLSFFKHDDSHKVEAARTFEKGGRRDAAQVIANGGVAALLALLSRFVPATMSVALLYAFTASLAAATADTWATELGTLSKTAPRLITTGRRVAAGTSGGVTWLGSAATALGALALGTVAAALWWTEQSAPQNTLNTGDPLALLMAGLIGGIIGSAADSILGATVQASYFCDVCRKPTESRTHHCGTATTLVRGHAWVTNDLVNGAATLIGALVGMLVWLIAGS